MANYLMTEAQQTKLNSTPKVKIYEGPKTIATANNYDFIADLTFRTYYSCNIYIYINGTGYLVTTSASGSVSAFPVAGIAIAITSNTFVITNATGSNISVGTIMLYLY